MAHSYGISILTVYRNQQHWHCNGLGRGTYVKVQNCEQFNDLSGKNIFFYYGTFTIS